VTAAHRVDWLRRTNPAAVDLAALCALAARVEPDLLRRLRLLLPGADAATEADLWFSDLLSGRDSSAITVDPRVADALRESLRDPSRATLRERAWAEITRTHATAHWSVRLEERIHYLDAARPPGAAEEIDDLLLAAMDRLRTEPDPRATARWLLGAAGRQPGAIRSRTASRASQAAAALHLDHQAPSPDLLAPAEAEAWLPWLTQTLPELRIPVQLLDGAVILGAPGEDAVLVSIPDTDPLVVEVRWHDGVRDHSRSVRFGRSDPVHIETGTRAAELITLTGTSYRLEPANGVHNGRYDHLKAALRPCLARESELASIARALADPEYARAWIGIAGREGSGTSTMLVAATDDYVAGGGAVIEYFFTGTDDPAAITATCSAQLAEIYGSAVPEDLPTALTDLDRSGALAGRPLVIALDELPDGPQAPAPFPNVPPAGVRYLYTGRAPNTRARQPFDPTAGGPRQVHVVTTDDRTNSRVCLAMAERERAAIERAVAEAAGPESLTELTGASPATMAALLGWLRVQPAGSVSLDDIPLPLLPGWPARAADLESSRPDLLGLLSAADGRNTLADCAEVAALTPDLRPWPSAWAECVASGIVADSDLAGIVRARAPLGPVPAAPFGHALLGVRGDPLPDFVRTATTTRFAAAVGHALAAGDRTEARALCTDPAFLARRYATDQVGLLTDLDAVADAPDLRTVLTAVRTLSRRRVAPSAFVGALHDLLAEYATLHAVPAFEALPTLPPMRVGRVIHDLDLRASTYVRTERGPALAISGNRGDNTVLVTAEGPRTLDRPEPEPVEGLPILGAVGGAERYLAWTRDRLLLGLRNSDIVQNNSELDSQVQFAAVLPDDSRGQYKAVTADAEGVLSLWAADGYRTRRPGHGGPVTAVLRLPDDEVASASEDGTVRLWSPGPYPSRVEARHRGPVRCLALLGGEALASGGDDGTVILSRGRREHWQAGPAPVTCLASLGGTLLVGSADGQVAQWDPNTGESAVIGRHSGPVRGIGVLRDGVVVSWATSVCFWRPYLPDPLVGTAGGFPGGVQHLVFGDRTYTVLAGDGSVHRRLLPTETAGGPHPEHTALGIWAGTVYFGLDDALCALDLRGGINLVRTNDAPFTQVAATRDGVVMLDATGVVRRPAGPDVGITGARLIAASPASDAVGSIGADGDVALTWSGAEPDEPSGAAGPASTSLAVSGLTTYAGQADGRVVIGHDRVLPGDGTALTTLAVLPDGTVVAGSETGTVRWWPTRAGPSSVPAHDGAVTGVAVATRPSVTSGVPDATWVVSAGRDGRLVLWDPATRQPVHEIAIGSPVEALAADPTQVAARDARGRLWTVHIDSPQATDKQLTANIVRSSDGRTLELHAPGLPVAYEIAAIRCSQDGRPIAVTNTEPWPQIAADGTLLVPHRPQPDRPLRLRIATDPGRPYTCQVDVLAPQTPGYRHTVQL
jgi:WD40 repeat protein